MAETDDRPDGETPPSDDEPQAKGAEDTKQDDPFDEERAKATIARQRESEKQAKAEAKAATAKAAQLEARLKAIEDADLSGREKAERERDEAKASAEKAAAELRNRTIRYEVSLAATKAKFRDPADAMAHLNHEAITFDDDGTPTNVADLIQAIAKAKPYLLEAEDDKAGIKRTPATDKNGRTEAQDQAAKQAEARRVRGLFR